MSNINLAIAICIGSPLSNIVKVKKTIESLLINIGTEDFKFIISMNPLISPEIKKYIYHKKEKYPKNFELMLDADLNWADFINQAIDRSRSCKYFIKAHDDIELLTSNFYYKVNEILNDIKEPVGWISFTDKDYINSHWAPSVRPGYHSDFRKENAWSSGKLFQFHKLPKKWYRKKWNSDWEKLLDYPKNPVKCHAPFNHFVLIKMEALLKLGYCENWGTKNALLVDEDWGLRAMEKGFFNIWIPSIEYIHQRMDSLPRKMFNLKQIGRFKFFLPSKLYLRKILGLKNFGGVTRSSLQIIQYQQKVHDLFKRKWGFNVNPSDEELEKIKNKFKNTNISWSMDRYSYDWDYIK